MNKYVVAVYMKYSNQLNMFCSTCYSEYDALLERYAGYFGTSHTPKTHTEIYKAFDNAFMAIEVIRVNAD